MYSLGNLKQLDIGDMTRDPCSLMLRELSLNWIKFAIQAKNQLYRSLM